MNTGGKSRYWTRSYSNLRIAQFTKDLSLFPFWVPDIPRAVGIRLHFKPLVFHRKSLYLHSATDLRKNNNREGRFLVIQIYLT